MRFNLVGGLPVCVLEISTCVRVLWEFNCACWIRRWLRLQLLGLSRVCVGNPVAIGVLDCYRNFRLQLWEVKGFPLNPQKLNFLQGGQQQPSVCACVGYLNCFEHSNATPQGMSPCWTTQAKGADPTTTRCRHTEVHFTDAAASKLA